MDNKELAKYAFILTWHYAQAIEYPFATSFIDLAANMLSPERFAAGLDPDELDELEQLLDAAIAEVAKRLDDAGEDPFGPLPSPPSPPLSRPPSPSEEP